MPTKKLYPCMLCEKRYAEIEEAEVCEQSHAAKHPVPAERAREAKG